MVETVITIVKTITAINILDIWWEIVEVEKLWNKEEELVIRIIRMIII